MNANTFYVVSEDVPCIFCLWPYSKNMRNDRSKNILATRYQCCFDLWYSWNPRPKISLSLLATASLGGSIFWFHVIQPHEMTLNSPRLPFSHSCFHFLYALAVGSTTQIKTKQYCENSGQNINEFNHDLTIRSITSRPFLSTQTATDPILSPRWWLQHWFPNQRVPPLTKKWYE